jgi:hypothetical protein
MFAGAFETLRKATDWAVRTQQEMFEQWLRLWPVVVPLPAGLGDPLLFRTQSAEAVGELLKKQREALEVQFRAGLRNIEETFHLGDAKDPEDLRTRIVAIWQRAFDCLRRTYEVQARDFRAATARLGHPDAAGGEVTDPRGRTQQGYGGGRSADYGCYPWPPPPSFPPGGVPGGATGTSRRTGPDATRPRRSRDDARRRWYAYWRSVRFARRMGFAPPPPDSNDRPAGS